MDVSGMESGAQEDGGGMPAGPEPYNPSGQTMPVDGGPGSSPTPAPGAVASPGSDDYTMEPNVSGSSEQQTIGRLLDATPGKSNVFAPMPTPDN